MDLHDECKDDKYLRASNPAKDSIDRIDLILKAVLSFLSTPLMEIAGKAAKLKPPITKTNVLKMDNNFKGAVALYDYIVAYDKPGYTVENSVVHLAPFSESLAEDLSEAGAMLSFLVYEYGLNLNDNLKERYQAEELKRRAALIAQRDTQLAVFKKKLENAEIKPEEYLLEMEKQVRLLQNDNRQLIPLRERVDELFALKEKSELEVSYLKNENAGLLDRVDEERAQKEIALSEMRSECEAKIQESEQKNQEKLLEYEQQCNAHFGFMEEQMRRKEAQCEEKVNVAKELLAESEAKYEELNQKYEALLEQYRVCDARLKGRKWQKGEPFPEEAFTEKEDFDELEKELEAFVNFYGDRWNKVKKSIRKKLLNYQALKGRKGER